MWYVLYNKDKIKTGNSTKAKGGEMKDRYYQILMHYVKWWCDVI